jgi:Kelch motif
MSRFTKIKNSLLLVLGFAVAAAAILIGLGFVGGSGPASSQPAPKVSGPWRSMPDAPEPIAAGRVAVWTGTEMIVAGVNPGSDGTFVHSTEVAESYNSTAHAWLRLATPPGTPTFCRRSAVWTGDKMLVWGCGLLAFDPVKNEWSRLPDPPTGQGIVAWTGRELIGWGGGCCGDVSDDGSAYNPETNTWRKLAPAPVGGQQSPAGAWTGHELVVLSGRSPDGDHVDGAAYNPSTDTWRRIAPVPAPYEAAQAVAHGDKLFVLGTRTGYASLLELDVKTNRWHDLGSVGRMPGVAALAGNQLIVLAGEAAHTDGFSYYFATGARVPFTVPSFARGVDQALVWTGQGLLVWGGMIPTRTHSSNPPAYLASGAVFSPRKVSPPLPQCCGGG